MTAGFSALAAAMLVGKRLDMTAPSANNIPFVILGAALLWFGWFGFNAGSAGAANALSVSAFATTNTAAASAGLSWMLFDVLRGRKPSVMGFCIGAVVGLVAITPAAGFVAIPQSIFIGVFAAVVSNVAVLIKQKSTKLDDTLDVFPCHGIGGMVGMLMTGVFATKAVNPAGNDGLFLGNVSFFFIQAKAMAIAVGYSFGVSFLIFKFINFVLPMRVTSEEEEIGLDATQHNEKYLQGTLLIHNNGKMEEKHADEVK
jgi:Amt family ammonium transporter